jgi:hypothetical protein
VTRVRQPDATRLTVTLAQADGYVIELDLAPRGPHTLVARAALHFLTLPLAGLALRGFCLWHTSTGLLVTPPRLRSDVTFLAASHLASPDASCSALQALEHAILAAYRYTQQQRPS